MHELVKDIDGVRVYIDQNESLKYETASAIQRSIHNTWLTLIHLLPIKFATKIFTRSSKDAKYVRDGNSKKITTVNKAGYLEVLLN